MLAAIQRLSAVNETPKLAKALMLRDLLRLDAQRRPAKQGRFVRIRETVRISKPYSLR